MDKDRHEHPVRGALMPQFRELVARISGFLFLERKTPSEVSAVNIQRLLVMMCVLVPVHLLHVLLFSAAESASTTAASQTVESWRHGIIAAHGVMLFVSLGMGWLTYRLRRSKREASPLGARLPVLAAAAYLMFGVALSVIDQLVIASITPYLMTALAVALVLIQRPLHVFLLYLVAWLMIHFGLSLTQAAPEVLLSMRVNAISATGIGLGLSLVVWRYNMIHLLQRSLIAAQAELMEEQNQQLRYLAGTDTLTSMNNRMIFMEVINQELARIRRGGPEGALLIMDIDHFKAVNDRFGHPGGDKALMQMAGVIRESLRESDTAARFGGEEFAILLPETSLDGAMRVAEKLRLAIQETDFDEELAGLKLTASIGIAPLQHGSTGDFDAAYRLADQALYAAKKQGRNRVVMSAECS